MKGSIFPKCSALLIFVVVSILSPKANAVGPDAVEKAKIRSQNPSLAFFEISTGGIDEISTGGIDEISTGGIEEISTGGIDEISTGGIDEISTGGIEEISTGGIEEISTGGIEEISTGGIEEISTGGIEEISTGGIEEISTGGIEEISTGGIEEISTGGINEISTGGIEEISTGGIDEISTGGIEEISTGGIEEISTGGIEEISTGGIEEISTGGIEEISTGGIDEIGTISVADSTKLTFDSSKLTTFAHVGAEFDEIGDALAQALSETGSSLVLAGVVEKADYGSASISILGQTVYLSANQAASINVGDYIGVVGQYYGNGAIQVDLVGRYDVQYNAGVSPVVSTLSYDMAVGIVGGNLIFGAARADQFVSVFGVQQSYGLPIDAYYAIEQTSQWQ